MIFLLSSMELTKAQYQLQEAFPNLSFTNAVDFQHAGDGSDRIFVVEQAGIIKVFPNNSTVSTANNFLDITDRVSSGGEMGLLGLAFHPDYETTGYFYVNYTVSNPRYTIISRFQVSAGNPNAADINSELILMAIPQPYSNHNGGQLAFGPDGYLYMSLGDGGGQGDPDNNAQNKSLWLGKILRIDVNSTQGALNYSIPSTNPFAGNTQGFKEEIYALGFRNPWRFSFDSETGMLWCADVGQWTLEEIDIVESGKNYGWRCYEGNVEHDLTDCNDNYTLPIWVYPRSEGYSITGGFVYRGPNLPELYGKYIYSDYGSRNVWALDYNGVTEPTNTLLLTASASPVSFGVDQNNELYICAFSGANDKIYRFVPTAAVIAPSNLYTTENPPNGIQLTWNDNSTNESGFKIERKSLSTGFVLIDSVGPNITSYINSGISEPQLYSYRVYAYNSTDVSGFSNQSSINFGNALLLTSFTALIEGLYNGSTMIPDTVTVELRNSFYPYALADQTKLLLNNSGNGSGSFINAVNGTPYYIVIKHRNSIETWSSSTEVFTNSVLTYDFTSGPGKAYENNLKQVGTKWCVYSGDVNQDGFINTTDLELVYTENINGAAGYTVTDLNGDMLTEIADLSLIFVNHLLGVEIKKPNELIQQPLINK